MPRDAALATGYSTGGSIQMLAASADVSPEPMLILSADLSVLAMNAASRRLLPDLRCGLPLDEHLHPSGLEFEGTPLGEAIRIVARKSAEDRPARLLVRRSPADTERLAFFMRLPGGAGVDGWTMAIEGSAAREDLVELRAKAREAAHSLNNVVMTAVGNVSLARLPSTSPSDASRLLDAAERNLLQVRDVTRSLQAVARKDITGA
jgi:hypothetical protein